MSGPLLIVLAGLDGLTGLALPAGAEWSLVPATAPILAFGLKLALAGVLALLAVRRFRYARQVTWFGIAAWTVGLVSNLRVLA